MNPIDERIQAIKSANALKVAKTEEATKHHDLVKASLNTQETILVSFKTLVEYMDNRVSKTAVVNQLREIGTPDALKVAEAVESLHTTIKEHGKVDLSQTTEVLNKILAEAEKVPKELPQLKDIVIPDNTKNFESLEKTVKSLEKAIKAQKLIAEAPVVNVPEAQVNVEAPDLSPIEKELEKTRKDFAKSIKGIVIPELKTEPVEKLIKKTNKLLNELLDTPSGGGGGGGSSWMAVNSNDVPVPIQLDESGAIVQTKPAMNEKITVSGTTTYVAKALPGTAQSASLWQAKRIVVSGNDTLITWAGGSGAYTHVATDLTALSYS